MESEEGRAISRRLEKHKMQITLANPNPSSSKTKHGPVYRVSFELTQDEWLWFMEQETAGMVIEADCTITHSNEPAQPAQPVELRLEAIRLCQNPAFQQWIGAKGESDASEKLRVQCQVVSRAQLDLNREAAQRFISIRGQFENDCPAPF